jgi:hypothetical protein
MSGMLPEEKAQLRLQVIEMFKHGFGSYMVRHRKDCFHCIDNLYLEICLSC